MLDPERGTRHVPTPWPSATTRPRDLGSSRLSLPADCGWMDEWMDATDASGGMLAEQAR